MEVRNLFSSIPRELPVEFFEKIVVAADVAIERLVSLGHSSPEGFWYDQEANEWVIVLEGSARLLFEGKEEAVAMNAGDYVTIPAHCRHRVEWTDPERKTVWLAVHYR
jgi:cupin 2 domain-containing protein